MPRKIYTSEQIIRKLREAEVLIAEGMTARNAARQIGVTEQTYYRWHKEYGGMKVNQAKRLKALEKENSRLICRGIPEHIRSDNGSEFTAKAVRSWLQRLGIKTLYIEPGSPWENGYIESSNGKLRDELLNREIFDTLFEAKVLVERWRREYNHTRPHSSLGYKPPAPEAVMPIDGITSLLLFGSAPLHLTTTANQNSAP